MPLTSPLPSKTSKPAKAKGLCSSPLISTPFWANRYVPSSVATEHFALLEAFSSLAYPAPTVVRAAAPTTTRISARPPAHSPLRFIVVLLLVCRPEKRGGLSLGLFSGRHTNRPSYMPRAWATSFEKSVWWCTIFHPSASRR